MRPKAARQQPWQPPGRAAPDKHVLHTPTGGAGPEVTHRGAVVPDEDTLQHARLNLRAHSEV
eukprot:120346-Prymnesium_polylepis.1